MIYPRRLPFVGARTLRNDAIEAQVLIITFPPGFFLPGGASGANLSGPLHLRAVEQGQCSEHAWLLCALLVMGLPDGEVLPYGARFSLLLTGIRTQPFAGRSGELRLETLSASSGSTLTADSSAAQSGTLFFTIAPRTLVNVSVEPSTILANTSAVNMSILLKAATRLPPDFRVRIYLPPDYTFSGLPLIANTARPDGNFSVAAEIVSVTVNRTTRVPQAAIEQSGTLLVRRSAEGAHGFGAGFHVGTEVGFRLGPFANPEVSGSTGTFRVAIETSDGSTIEASNTLPGHVLQYIPPRVTVVIGEPQPTVGGGTVTIIGDHFGPVPPATMTRATPPPMAKVGDTQCAETIWISDTALVCSVRPGFGRNLSVRLEVEHQHGSGFFLEGFSRPSLRYPPQNRSNASSEEGWGNLPARGNASVILSGANFGAWDASVAGVIGSTASEATTWTSNSALICLAARSIAGTLSAIITVVRQYGTATAVLSYDAPITAAMNATLPTGRLKSAELTGLRFGNYDSSVMCRSGFSSAEMSQWISDSQLKCAVASGIAGTQRVAVTVGQRSASRTAAASYQAPILEVLSRDTASAPKVSAEQYVRSSNKWIGHYLGISDYSAKGRLGGTGCEASVWTSDSSLACRSAAGLGRSASASVTAGSQTGTVTEAASYDAPTIAGGAANVASRGVDMLSVVGSNIGAASYSAKGRLGGTGCEASVWTSDSSLACRSAAGLGRSASASVTAGTQTGTVTEAASYDTSVLRSVAVSEQGLLDTVSGGTATLVGSWLGDAAYSGKGRVGGTGCEASVWTSDSIVECRVSSGTLRTLSLAVTVGGSTGSLTEVLSYEALSTSSVRFTNLEVATTSGVTVSGSGLGVVDSSAAARVGGSACEKSMWTSDTAVQCQTKSGTGKTHRIAVTAARCVGTVSGVLSIDAPQLKIARNNLIVGIGSSVILVASGLMSADSYTARGRLGGTGCEASVWTSDSSLACRSAAGLGRSASASVTAGSQTGTVTEAASYDAPTIAGGAANVASRGVDMLSVVGSNIGAASYSAKGRLGGTGCEASVWTSDSSLACRSAAGLGRSASASVTAGTQTGTVTEAASYDTSVLRSVAVSEQGLLDTVSGGTATLVGSWLGDAAYSGKGRVGGTGCEASVWTSDSIVECRVSSGTLRTLSLAVTVGGSTGSLTEVLSYEALSTSSVRFTNLEVATTSGVTVSGSGLGVVDSSAAARVGGSACEKSMWTSDTAVQCQTKSGTGKTHRIAVTAARCVGTVSGVLSIDAPQLKIARNNLIVGIGSSVILVASGLMSADSYTARGRLGGTGCEASVWTSDSSLACRSAAGLGRSASASVTAGSQTGTVTEAASYDAPTIAGGAANVASRGVDMLSVVGSNIGAASYSAKGRLGGTGCEASVWTSDSSLACRSAAGLGGTTPVAITLCLVSSSLSDATSYDVPPVSGILISNVMTLGSSFVTLSGSDFGSFDTTVGVRIESSSCIASKWFSLSSVVCHVTAGVSSSASVAVTVTSQAGTLSEALSFDRPEILRVGGQLANAPSASSSGGRIRVLLGIEFGRFDSTQQGRAGGTACESSVWTSSSAVLCSAARITGGSKILMLTATMQAGKHPIQRFQPCTCTCRQGQIYSCCSSIERQAAAHSLQPLNPFTSSNF